MGSDEKGLSLWIEVESASVAVGCMRSSGLSPPTSARLGSRSFFSRSFF
jgi:hypothetical protein